MGYVKPCSSCLTRENRLKVVLTHLPLDADSIFKCIYLIEKAQVLIQISLKFVPMGPINNMPALVQIMAWGRPDDKPLSEPILIRLSDEYMRH